jgi:hypothetical protein
MNAFNGLTAEARGIVDGQGWTDNTLLLFALRFIRENGHLKEKQFVTKIRKTFTRGEMNDDLEIMPAKLGQAEDHSEYDEVLPTSPP